MTENQEQTVEEQGTEAGPGIEGVDFAPGREKKAAEEAGNGVETPPTGEEAPAQESVEDQDPLARARLEIEELKDNWHRERAEFANFRKRQMNERAKLRSVATGDFVQKLLPALDNLERVLGAKTEDPAVQNFVIGVDMIHKEILQVLEREKIKIVSPDGQAFDPFMMEAVAMEDRDDLEKETVLEVFQPGFVLEIEDGERQVLRPARVKVGKPTKAGGGADVDVEA